jgi:hypothetical protein
MSKAPVFPAQKPTTDQLVMPRAALCEYMDDACQDLVTSRAKFYDANTADELVSAVTEAHQVFVDHGELMGEFVRLVRRWQSQPGA